MTAPQHTSTILIVDDTPDNITVLLEFLEEHGFKVLVGENGEAALAALEVEEPDLILLDVMMPGLGGLATCRIIKSMPAGRDVPVFFMTALGDPYDKVRGIEAGAVDYITKPIYPQEVLARIRTHLEIRRLQKGLQEQNDRLDAALQRSITAERALANLLDRAVVIVRCSDHEILFTSKHARQLLDAHGGDAALQTWLRDGSTGETAIELKRTAHGASSDEELITLSPKSPPVGPETLRPLGLTPREAEILYWIAQGKTNPEIATILGVQVFTIKKHVFNFLPKLGVDSRLAAALRAHELLNAPVA